MARSAARPWWPQLLWGVVGARDCTVAEQSQDSGKVSGRASSIVTHDLLRTPPFTIGPEPPTRTHALNSR